MTMVTLETLSQLFNEAISDGLKDEFAELFLNISKEAAVHSPILASANAMTLDRAQAEEFLEMQRDMMLSCEPAARNSLTRYFNIYRLVLSSELAQKLVDVQVEQIDIMYRNAANISIDKILQTALKKGIKLTLVQ